MPYKNYFLEKTVVRNVDNSSVKLVTKYTTWRWD